MLKDIEKDKIRLEEVYRHEVRQLLESKPTRRSKIKILIDFLGSSLGLWILSAIFLTLGAKLYEDYKNRERDRTDTEEKVEKIDLEISYRFCRVLVDLYLLIDRNTGKEKLSNNISPDSVSKVALSLQERQVKYFLYSEYNNYPLMALLAEQKRLLNHLNKSDPDLDTVIQHITGLPVFYEVHKINYSDVRQIAGTIEDELLISRWKKNNFYFFDGGKNGPFP